MVQAGMLIKGEARMPRSMVKPSGLFTRKARMLRPDAIAQWNVNNAKLLKTFGLKIAAVEDMELCPAVREAGPFEVLLSQRATLGAALPAVGLSFEARGSLLELAPDLRKGAKGEHKEGADLWASSAELEVLYTVVEENPDIAFLVQVGEGAGDADRRKPGEGLNASLYPGQLIVNQQHAGVPVEGLPGRGVTVLEIATDPIDGTTKTVMFDHSAVTSLLIVNGKIRRVPDVYMEKLTVDQVAANSGLDTDEPLDKIVQGLADTHEALPHQLNGFHLLRGERHPTQHLLGLGLNIVAIEKVLL